MSEIAAGLCFISALGVTLSRGAGFAFARVFLPALTLLALANPVALPGLPDSNPAISAMYGILLGSGLRGRGPGLRLVAPDYVMLLLIASYVASAVATAQVYTGVALFGTMTMQVVAPYFVARASLRERPQQREVVIALVAVSLVLAPFALIEMRMWPSFYAELMASAGLYAKRIDFAFHRFGLFRAAVAFPHPIDLGLTSALCFASMLLLAIRTGMRLDGVWLRLGLLSSLVASLTALSFTSLFGLACGVAIYGVLSFVPITRRFAFVGVLAVIVIGIFYTEYLASAPLTERPLDDQALTGSLWVRQLIINRAWRVASSAGFFGWGAEVAVGDLTSLDNAYLLITIQRGLVTLGLWLALPLALAAQASRALMLARGARAIRPILIGFSASVATMIAMFTVFYGFAYATFLPIVIALTVNQIQAVTLTPRRPRSVAPAPLVLRPETGGSS